TIEGANVFLLNPFGIVFGSDAQIDVPGSFTASSADVVRFGSGEDFTTGAPVANGALLSVEDPVAFGFTRATPGSIEIDRTLQPELFDSLFIDTGETLALIGGDGRVAGRGVNVPTVIGGGSFAVASVRGPAEVPADVAAFEVDGLAPEQLGEVAFTHQAILLLEGAGGGRVVVRGGQLVIDEQSLVATATLSDVDAPEVGIDVAVAGAFVVAGVAGLGDGEQNTLLRTSSLGSAGRGADISVEAGSFAVRDGAVVWTESVAGSGAGGDLVVKADSVRIESGGRVDTATTGFDTGFEVIHGTGGGGDPRIEAGALEVAADGVIRTVTTSEGRGGDLTLAADRVLVEGEVSPLPSGLDDDAAGVAGGPGGDLRIEGDEVVVRAGGLVTTEAFGDEDAGQIAIDAGTLEGSGSLSGIQAFGAATSQTGGTGGGGPITVSAQRVALSDGGVLTVSAQGEGGAGRIDVQAGELTIAGLDANGKRSGNFAK